MFYGQRLQKMSHKNLAAGARGGVSVIERECIRNKESAPHLFVFASWKSLKGKQQVILYQV